MWRARRFKKHRNLLLEFLEFVNKCMEKKAIYSLSEPPRDDEVVRVTGIDGYWHHIIPVTVVYIERTRDNQEAEWACQIRFFHTLSNADTRHSGDAPHFFDKHTDDPTLLPYLFTERMKDLNVEISDFVVFPGHLKLTRNTWDGVEGKQHREFYAGLQSHIEDEG